MRTDALKLLKGMQRPHPRGANDIGNWYNILVAISYLAVITNSAMLVFTSQEISRKFPGWDAFEKLWFAIIAEVYIQESIYHPIQTIDIS